MNFFLLPRKVSGGDCFWFQLKLVGYCFKIDKLLSSMDQISNLINNLQLRLFHLWLQRMCLMKSPRGCRRRCNTILSHPTFFSHLIISTAWTYSHLLVIIGVTSSGQDILRESFSFDLLLSASCEVLLLNPESNPLRPDTAVGASEGELLNRLFLLRCLALPWILF